MRLRVLPFLFACGVGSITSLAADAVPPELASALAAFRPAGAFGYAFTQTTTTPDHHVVERFDPRGPDFTRWTLVEKEGQPPNEKELHTYRAKFSARTMEQPPSVVDQLDRNSCTPVGESGDEATWRFNLVPGDRHDSAAEHMHADITLHRPSGAIVKVVMEAFETIKPAFGVTITEARTEMLYSLPTPEQPSLLMRVTMRARGDAFWIKSMDQDMDVVYTEHHWAGKKSAE